MGRASRDSMGRKGGRLKKKTAGGAHCKELQPGLGPARADFRQIFKEKAVADAS